MKPVSVSQLNRYIKTVLQTDPVLGNISVVGEISNLKYHGTGHVYFSLKDRNSRINCFLPADKVRYIRFPLEDGMEVVASGYLYLYEKGGYYSLNVGDIVVEGTGNLRMAFDKLKVRLEREGLFDPSAKKPLPRFPKNIAIITSETGAAVRDMIRTIKNKNNYVNLLLFPCLVQGDAAAADIAENIDLVNRAFPQVDVMIVGRGGGSMEELWAFNEELVARSIFRSECPIISAVGHETDFTIADFVADMRAATPTAAAEAAVPDIRELRAILIELNRQMRAGVRNQIDLWESRLSLKAPEQMILFLENRMDGKRSESERLMGEMTYRMREILNDEEHRLSKVRAAMEALNPKNLMEMGYGAVSDEKGRFFKSVSGVEVGDRIYITMSDGTLDCLVEGKQTSKGENHN